MTMAKISRLGHWQIASWGLTEISEANQLLADPNLLTEYPHYEVIALQNLEKTQKWPSTDGGTKEVNWVMGIRWWKTLTTPEEIGSPGVDNEPEAG